MFLQKVLNRDRFQMDPFQLSHNLLHFGKQDLHFLQFDQLCFDLFQLSFRHAGKMFGRLVLKKAANFLNGNVHLPQGKQRPKRGNLRRGIVAVAILMNAGGAKQLNFIII